MQAQIVTENGQQFIVVKVAIEQRPSKTGKTTIVASSGGNMATSAIVDGKPVVVGFNAYIK